jgi:ferrous iron transport protein B
MRTGDTIVITKVLGEGAFRKRIAEMGFVKGQQVKVIKNAPLQDPVEYELMGYNVSMRRSEAGLIEVLSPEEALDIVHAPYSGVIANEIRIATTPVKDKTIRVALVGNPNSGKTTLFNYASASHERVGNYGGVTVEAKEARIYRNEYVLKMVDLPGTYSITEYSPEELFVRSHLLNNKPDVVINVIDASNLERNLFLTTQLIDLNIKIVIALNMFDELEKKGGNFIYNDLGRMIGIPFVPTIASKGKGIEDLISKIIEVNEGKDPVARNVQVNYGNFIERSIKKIKDTLEIKTDLAGFSTRYVAIKLLENDKTTLSLLQKNSSFSSVEEIVQCEIVALEKEFGETSETVITDARYGFIAGALKETYESNPEPSPLKSHKIDRFITHKFFGFPIFIIFIWAMFQTTPMKLIDSGVAYISIFIRSSMPEGALRDLIVDGIIGGVGGVIIFLPNILILFFFISLMEDTGYMARVSFIMDKLMHKIGLHGKSFIPLLMGFGCNVPAIMATRTLENRKDRILTMIIAPFMSCSARLPVYVLIISAFFPKNQGLVMFSVYLIGIFIAILVALLLKNTVFSKQDVPFVMELPTYRMPTIKNTTKHMWYKGSQYLRKMGSIILMASILIWGLSYYPRHVKYETNYDSQISLIKDNSNMTEAEKLLRIDELELLKAAERQEKSYIGQIGHFIEPVIKPLGFDWKIGISIITGLAAKEIVVGSMGILYQADLEADETSGSLIEKLQRQVHSSGSLSGQRVFTPLVAFGFMVFVLIYFPCIAVIAAIKKESNWKWAIFSMIYTTVIAWTASFLIYQIGSLVVYHLNF